MQKLFLAYLLPETNALEAIQANLKPYVKGKVNWIAPERMHCTVFFVGRWKDANQLIDRLKPIFSVEDEFSIQLDSLRVFWSSAGHPRVLYATPKEDGKMEALNVRAKQALHDLPLFHKQKPFTPHVTLARINKVSMRTSYFLKEELSELSLPTPAVLKVDSLSLLNSVPDRFGVSYETEHVFRLRQ